MLVLGVEQVGLVDHQHASSGKVYGLPHIVLLVAPVLAYEGAAVGSDDVTSRERSGLAQQRAEDLADGGLARARTPEEEAVERYVVRLGPREGLCDHGVVACQRQELVDALLDIGTAHQLVEFGPRIRQRLENLHPALQAVLGQLEREVVGAATVGRGGGASRLVILVIVGRLLSGGLSLRFLGCLSVYELINELFEHQVGLRPFRRFRCLGLFGPEAFGQAFNGRHHLCAESQFGVGVDANAPFGEALQVVDD